ncbi:MAG: UbiX family flavin prenyltransferase [Phycisphaerales bacterium]|nr:UbiX family flavin prenyltransferase [Phycisphaerales bacterium]
MPPTNQSDLPQQRRIVVGISGASGAQYAARLVEQLLLANTEVHLVATDFGKRLLADELKITTLNLNTLCPSLASHNDHTTYESNLIIHPNKDVGALIASGSFLHDGMVVIPCSSTSLGSIATGSGNNLLTRAAAVTLKERRKLILVHRETPLSLIDIENMRTITLAGGIICPANPGLYLNPQSINDLIDFIVAKALDLLDIKHNLATRWQG